MKKMQALRALRYNQQKIADMSKVVAPPYDVIGPAKQEQLFQQSPYNIAWVDLSKEENGKDKYQVAGEKFQQWRNEGVIQQDDEPSIYVYFQTYSLPDKSTHIRKGFFARRLAEPFGEGLVKPHEKTFSGPKEDRFLLTQATSCHMSPVFGLFQDEDAQVQKLIDEVAQAEPCIDISFGENERHRVWQVKDPLLLQSILNPLEERMILIADGHHRYETAVRYAQWKRSEEGDDSQTPRDSDYALMYFCPVQDPGLVILPTHRVLHVRPQLSPEQFRQKLPAWAHITSYQRSQLDSALAALEDISAEERAVLWVYDQNIDLIRMSLQDLREKSILKNYSAALSALDVSVLHSFLFEEMI
ncbi:MAG: DUF1015 domain-containing protein, partial [Chlamydiia bacterium]|nr:DUF1015 domain-containing protein [Chlamydiia bacterium]